jgi:hypothetical protein
MDPRLSAFTITCLKEYEEKFGEKMWEYATLVFTRFPDIRDSHERDYKKADVKKKVGVELKRQIPGITNVLRTELLPCVFIDSVACLPQAQNDINRLQSSSDPEDHADAIRKKRQYDHGHEELQRFFENAQKQVDEKKLFRYSSAWQATHHGMD